MTPANEHRQDLVDAIVRLSGELEAAREELRQHDARPLRTHVTPATTTDPFARPIPGPGIGHLCTGFHCPICHPQQIFHDPPRPDPFRQIPNQITCGPNTGAFAPDAGPTPL